MDEQKKTVSKKTVLSVAVAAALVGWVLGPAAVRAAGSVVTLSWSGNQAKVSKAGELRVDTDGPEYNEWPLAYAYTAPGGINTLATGNSSKILLADFGFLTGIVVDNQAASGKVTVTVKDGAGNVLWLGSVKAGEHLNDQIDNGVFWDGNLDVHVTGTGATYVVYGQYVAPV